MQIPVGSGTPERGCSCRGGDVRPDAAGFSLRKKPGRRNSAAGCLHLHHPPHLARRTPNALDPLFFPSQNTERLLPERSRTNQTCPQKSKLRKLGLRPLLHTRFGKFTPPDAVPPCIASVTSRRHATLIQLVVADLTHTRRHAHTHTHARNTHTHTRAAKMMRAQLEQRQQRQHPERGAAGTRGSSTFPPLQNRAGESDSPYVRRHADTPVAWQVLDAETLARATAENKPIFMHIGFLADHRKQSSAPPFGSPC